MSYLCKHTVHVQNNYKSSINHTKKNNFGRIKDTKMHKTCMIHLRKHT